MIRKHFGIKSVPFKSRQSYFYERRAAIFDGIFVGLALNLLLFVARKTIHVSEYQATFIATGFFIGPFVGTFLPQIFGSAKKKNYVVWGGILCRTPLFFIIFVSSPLLFTLIAFWIAVVCGIAVSAYVGIMGSNYPFAVRSSILSKVKTVQMLAIIVSGLIAGWALRENENLFKLVFCVGAVAGLLHTYFFSKIIVRDERRKHYKFDRPLYSFADILRVIKKDGHFRRYEAIFFLGGLPMSMSFPLVVLLITDSIEADYQQISFITSVLKQTVILAFLPFWGWFLDKKSNPIFGRAIFSFIMATQMMIYAMTTNIWYVYAATIVAGIAFAGGMLNWLLGVLYFCEPEDSSLYSAVHAFCSGTRGLIGPSLGLLAYKLLGFGTTFFFLGLLTALCGFLFVRFYLEDRTHGEKKLKIKN